jgi:hypothetical protein
VIYFIGELGPDGKPNGVVKIGYTNGESAKDRLSSLQSGNARKLRVLKEIGGTAVGERELHGLLASWRLEGEWFAFSTHALAVCSWKRVVNPVTFIAALGLRHAQAEKRRLADDAARLIAAKIADDARAPEWLAPVIDPDDGPASGGAALPHPSVWARRVVAAGVVLARAA